jgi:hypothetical protein
MGPSMPIRFLIEHNHSFGPDDIAKLVEGFEGALNTLGLVRRDDPATMLVAKAIMDAAKTGEREPTRLRDLVVERLTREAPPLAPEPPNSLPSVAAAPAVAAVAEERQVAAEIEPSRKRPADHNASQAMPFDRQAPATLEPTVRDRPSRPDQ